MKIILYNDIFSKQIYVHTALPYVLKSVKVVRCSSNFTCTYSEKNRPWGVITAIYIYNYVHVLVNISR